MKISLLLKREPFGEIFEQTLKSFLSNFYENEYNVKWLNRTEWKDEYDKAPTQKWLCNPLINSIYVNEAVNEVFNAIKWEYSKNPLRPWRSALQKFYLYLAIKSKFGSILAPYLIMVSPEINNAHNMLIIGGNTKIRIIDNANKIVFVILKQGFKQKYIEREILIRQNYGYLPVPPIKQTGKVNWYSEKLVSGISPDRLSKDLEEHIIVEASLYIHRLLKDTMRKESVDTYVNLTIKNITNKVKGINQISNNLKKDILQAVNTIVDAINKTPYFTTGGIYTSMTHGDFQQGNILYDKGKIWILDWEHAQRRQVGNDALVLILKSRSPTGFASRYIKLANNEIKGPNKSLLLDWPYLNWEDDNSRRLSLMLYLLEEIDFLLEENFNSVFYGETLGLSPFFNEMKQLLKYFNE